MWLVSLDPEKLLEAGGGGGGGGLSPSHPCSQESAHRAPPGGSTGPFFWSFKEDGQLTTRTPRRLRTLRGLRRPWRWNIETHLRERLGMREKTRNTRDAGTQRKTNAGNYRARAPRGVNHSRAETFWN
uniref:Uncharacterized protein n=1 Tax=Molossus molossus TaxID=27622 RepID=A0A7J8BYB9_MOLMO|nr:hypothetical protein HJG59_010014 [Molossus molossus]